MQSFVGNLQQIIWKNLQTTCSESLSLYDLKVFTLGEVFATGLRFKEISVESDFAIINNQFQISIDGFNLDHCTSVSPVHLKLEKVSLPEEPNRDTVFRKGRSLAGDVELVRLFTDKKFFQWFRDCQKGKVQKRSCSIILFDSEKNEKLRLNLFHVWPTAWRGPRLSADSHGEACYETITLAVESVEMA
jgi:phage tail-like protein